MGEKSYVTYEDVVRFYKDKKEWPCYTKKFIEAGYGQEKSTGNYLNVAEVFFQKNLELDDEDSNGNEKSDDEKLKSKKKPDDERFYLYLMKKKKDEYKKLKTFKDFENEEKIRTLIENTKLVSVCKESGKEIETIYPSQKWHFYVSYITYQEFKGDIGDFAEEEFKYWRFARCPELMLWMAETALGKECFKVESVFNEAMQEFEEFEKKRKAGQDIEQAQGKAEKRKDVEIRVCKMIRRKIPWTCIEEKIKEKTHID